MSADQRINWLHKKISTQCYPSQAHLIQKYSISRRQAQRDVDYLRDVLGAPIAYSSRHRGYYYTAPFALPIDAASDGEGDLGELIAELRREKNSPEIQLMLPYSALLEIKDIMTVLNMRGFITSDEPKHRYRCDFKNAELFIGTIISAGADVKIIEPEWLRNRLVEFARRVLENNSDCNSDEKEGKSAVDK